MDKNKAPNTSKKNTIVLVVCLLLFVSLQVLLYISERKAFVLNDIRGILFIVMIGVLLVAIFRKKKIIPNIVTKEDALKLAYAYCLEKNWPWYGKIDIRSDGSKWNIGTNSEYMGGNVNIRISKRTGEILSAGFAPR